MLNKGPILLGGFVTALALWATDHPGLAVLAVCAGIMATRISRPFRDPVRLFSDDDRRTILRRAGGCCENCGRPVHYEGDCPRGGCPLDFQADHVVAWARGGRTTLENSACLCRMCNVAKSDN